MSNDFVAEANAKSAAALWTAYCDKKMELEEAQDRIKKLESVLHNIAYPPKEVNFSGQYTTWAMQLARQALRGNQSE